MEPQDLKTIFDYFDQQHREYKIDLARVEQKVDTLTTAVDNLAKLVKDFRDEHIVLHRRLEVLEDWAKKVSERVGIPLPSDFVD